MARERGAWGNFWGGDFNKALQKEYLSDHHHVLTVVKVL